MRGRSLAIVAALASAACGPAEPAPATPAAAAPDAASRVRAFESLEDEILRDLATIDRRIAKRARIEPREDDKRRVALGALLREDSSLAVVDGTVDPFSFDARARGLEAARRKVAALPAPLPDAPSGATSSPALERELLSRLVGEEEVRLEEERALPRSASALVRAMVDTWPAPSSVEQVAEIDRWLARRLRELGEALADDAAGRDPTAALDLVRARELDDALDALERLVDAPAFTMAPRALERVRDALEAEGSRKAATVHSEWAVVARRLKAHLGLAASAEEIDARLDALEKDLRARAEAAVEAAHLTRDDLEDAIAEHVFASGECGDAVPGSRVRSLSAPPERAPGCHLRHLVARAEGDRARAAALVAMHDHVVVASWALDVARGAVTLSAAEARRRPIAPPAPDLAARYERIALARPVAALCAGEVVRILVASGDAFAAARAWSKLGDVPLDVAERALRAR